MIAYDTNILIYALEGGSEFSAAAQAVIVRGEQEGAVISVLAWQELLTGRALKSGPFNGRFRLSLSQTKFVPVSMAICEQAAVLTQRYGKKLYGYDAIHLATALDQGADYFVTNDQKLLSLNFAELEVKGLVSGSPGMIS